MDKITSGLLSFPLTDFDTDDNFDASAYANRVEWLSEYGASGIFAAGGAGEFFSLTDSEFQGVIRTAVSVSRGVDVPVFASTGYGTRKAVELAQEAERLGADGLLVLPPYMVESTQEGLRAHLSAICRATSLAIIVYNRANCRLKAETLRSLADEYPNLIGFKDGVGNIEELLQVETMCGDRVLVINGMPTAEVFARSYKGMGISTYSSAIFNFVPRSAVRFHRAIAEGDAEFIEAFTRGFLIPFRRICSRHAAYSISLIKAGADIVDRSAGTVRPPLSMPTTEECDELAVLIEQAGPQN